MSCETPPPRRCGTQLVASACGCDRAEEKRDQAGNQRIVGAEAQRPGVHGQAADCANGERRDQRGQCEQQQRPGHECARWTKSPEHGNCRNRVAPADLLAGCARPRGERDWPLVDAMTAQQQPGRDFGLDIEPVGGELEPMHDVRVHDLVAGLHVGNRRPEDDVRERRQPSIREYGQPGSGRTRAEESGAVNHGARSGQDGSHQRSQLRRVELQVGILDRDHRSLRTGEPLPNRMSLPAVPLGMDHGQRRHRRQRIQHAARAVAGAVVDDDDFAIRGQIDLEQPGDHGSDRCLFVEDRNDNRDERRAGARAGQSWMTSFARRP